LFQVRGPATAPTCHQMKSACAVHGAVELPTVSKSQPIYQRIRSHCFHCGDRAFSLFFLSQFFKTQQDCVPANRARLYSTVPVFCIQASSYQTYDIENVKSQE